MELLLLDKEGIVVSDLGGLIQAHGSKGVDRESTFEIGKPMPSWLTSKLEGIVEEGGWQSVRDGSGGKSEYWVHAIGDHSANDGAVAGKHQGLFLVLKDWIPTAQLVEGPSSLATIVHDMKNPIGAMFGYADALLDTDLGKGLAPKHLTIVDRIRKASARSLDLLKNYESLLYIGRRRQAAVSDLNKMLSLVLETSGIQDHEKRNIVVDQCEGSLFVAIQRFSLDRIVSNLFGNAVKYTPESGSITLKTSKTEESGIFTVTNTGCPIPESERGSIFEARKRGSTGRDIAGTGMGLYTVKLLVQNAGGTIDLKVGEDGSNTFTVVLPYAPPETRQEAESNNEVLPE